MKAYWRSFLLSQGLALGLLFVLAAGVHVASAVSQAPAGSLLGVCPTQTTPLPVPITLTVTLQRPNSPPPSPAWAVPVTFTLYPPGDSTTICHQWELMLDQSGRWKGLLDLFTGVYDARIRNLHTLRNVKRNLTIIGPATIDMGTLLEGDADADNRVRSSDYALLSASYFTQEGEAGFDPRTDFDEDNRIRSSDYALLSSNYFMSGDIEVPGLSALADLQGLSGTVDVALEPGTTQATVGVPFTLTLMAHAHDQPFVALDADIRFPPHLLQVIGPDGQPATTIEPLPPLSAFYNRVDNVAGRILYAAGVMLSTVSGDIQVAQIRFLPLAPVTRAQVELVDVTVSDRTGKFVTGSLTSAQVNIEPVGGFRYLYLPMLLNSH
jgi:hypothetical protein